MSFKTAMEKVKQMFGINIDEEMQKYEDELHKSTNDVVELRIAVKNKVEPRLCLYIAPGADIDRVQKLYEKVGIKTNKHLLVRGNRRQNILYINSSDFAKLDAKRQKYFKRTALNHKLYKQNLTYSVKKERVH